MFMHDTHSFAHVFFNMFGVYMFGRVLENVWGPKRFLIFYMVTGIGGGYYAGTGLAVFRPFLRKCERGYSGTVGCRRSFIELSDYDRCFWFRVRYFAGICHVVPECSAVPDVHPYSYQGKIFRDLFTDWPNCLWVSLTTGGDSVAHFAHLGGMLFGYFLVRYWKKKDIDNGRYFLLISNGLSIPATSWQN